MTAVAARSAVGPRVFEDICEQIRLQLTRGELKPGDKLPSERDLAERFGASRAAVREALRHLERGGITELRRGVKGGTYVARTDPAMMTQSLDDLLSFGRISIESLAESRAILQDAVVRLACERGTDEDFDELEASLDRTEALTQEGHFDERRRQLLEFYLLLGRATHNEVMLILVTSVTDMVLKLLQRESVPPRPTTIRTHRRILACLRARDKAQAASLMATHLEQLHSFFAKAAKAKARATLARGRPGSRARAAGPAARYTPKEDDT